MAEAVVSFAVERIGELLISEANLLHGVSDQINEIQDELDRMQCFLEEADKKQNQDRRVRKWVAQMRELSFKIEDVIETFALEVMAKKQISGFKENLLRFACILDECVSRHNIATEINHIKAELANLTASLQTYGVTEGLKEGETSRSLVDLKSRRTYSHDVERDFVGMENEIEQLISRLKNEDNGCEVVSICGMGGLGKTTLAKIVYNHEKIKTHFDAFAWVCITQQFEREKVLKGILRELLPTDREGEVSMMDDAKLVKELYKVQQEKNCLIVIDDIWTVNSWESIRPAFPVQEATGNSKILLTTRDVTVAEIGCIYKLQGLTEEQGWQLLSKKAGVSSDPSAEGEMKEIGRSMVKRCKGLPLAISTLGGLLKGKLLREWENINRDISFYLSKGDSVVNDDEYGSVTGVLGLSYDSLPPRLRHCFLYFANYKEDEIINTKGLYMHWIAEGLIPVQDKAEGEMILDVAERYLDELVHRNLVQIEPSTTERKREYWLKYKKCRVHDVIRDLCLSKAKEEKFINIFRLRLDPVDELKPSTVRRLCINLYDDRDVSKLRPYDQHVLSHVRSFVICNSTFKVWPDKILGLEKFKLLRVLKAERYKLTKQDMRSISELIYLKYLCLRDCELVDIPTSVGNLRNLETLDLRVRGLTRIPNVLWKLKHLKHLYLPSEKVLKFEKLRFEGLNDLELIYNYDSSCCDSKDLIQLSKLKAFRGEIRVEDNFTESVIHFIKYREWRHSRISLNIEGEGKGVCLVNLLECGFIDIMIISTRICKFPEEYHYTHLSGHLSELTLTDCGMEEDPMILVEKLPNLHSLLMFNNAYLGEEMVCSATGFPRLKYLLLSKLQGLKKLSLHQGTMPNIRAIIVSECEKLEMLPEGLTHLTRLESINFYQMSTAFTNRIKVTDGVEAADTYYMLGHTKILKIVWLPLDYTYDDEFDDPVYTCDTCDDTPLQSPSDRYINSDEFSGGSDIDSDCLMVSVSIHLMFGLITDKSTFNGVIYVVL